MRPLFLADSIKAQDIEANPRRSSTQSFSQPVHPDPSWQPRVSDRRQSVPRLVPVVRQSCGVRLSKPLPPLPLHVRTPSQNARPTQKILPRPSASQTPKDSETNQSEAVPDVIVHDNNPDSTLDLSDFKKFGQQILQRRADREKAEADRPVLAGDDSNNLPTGMAVIMENPDDEDIASGCVNAHRHNSQLKLEGKDQVQLKVGHPSPDILVVSLRHLADNPGPELVYEVA